MRTKPVPIAHVRDRYPSLAVSGYQRAVVWGQSQRAALIRSFLEDYPTGLVVLNRIAPPKANRSDPLAGLYLPRVEIIDGQQRLSTVFDFLQSPLVYFTDWAPRIPPKVDEPREIRLVRERLDALTRELRKAKAQYAPRRATRRDLLLKIAEQTGRELARRESGKKVEDPRFHQLVDAVAQLKTRVGRCNVVVEELRGLDSGDAERIYDVINSSGTRLKWWELLWGREHFVHTDYAALLPYRTRWNDQVERVALFYRMKNIPRDSPIKSVPPDSVSLWHAMYALGHYVYCKFAQKDPKTHPRASDGAIAKPKVDGLGFRLVSTFLGHDVSRAGVYGLLDRYSADQIRQTIDLLFDTADAVFDPYVTGDYQFFAKYAAFYADPLPAYPLIGLFVAAAKYISRNAAEGNGSKLTTKDTVALRALTEELFRDAVCTTNWAGTGDTKLEQWLGTHFVRVASQKGDEGAQFPGEIKAIDEAPKPRLWLDYMSELTGSSKRNPDRRAATFLFWTQYILDSNGSGALPRGVAQFDHIVPFNRNYPQTGNPLNIAAISSDLNRSKGNLTYSGWAPSPEEDRRYRAQVMCQPEIPNLPVTAATDFLSHATFTEIGDMVGERRKVFEFVLTTLTRQWISRGDSK